MSLWKTKTRVRAKMQPRLGREAEHNGAENYISPHPFAFVCASASTIELKLWRFGIFWGIK